MRRGFKRLNKRQIKKITKDDYASYQHFKPIIDSFYGRPERKYSRNRRQHLIKDGTRLFHSIVDRNNQEKSLKRTEGVLRYAIKIRGLTYEEFLLQYHEYLTEFNKLFDYNKNHYADAFDAIVKQIGYMCDRYWIDRLLELRYRMDTYYITKGERRLLESEISKEELERKVGWLHFRYASLMNVKGETIEGVVYSGDFQFLMRGLEELLNTKSKSQQNE